MYMIYLNISYHFDKIKSRQKKTVYKRKTKKGRK